jgi:signal transduction histidine kinase
MPTLASWVEDRIDSWVREALVNILQHARPTHVWITQFRSGEKFIIEVADDGTGLSVEAQAWDDEQFAALRLEGAALDGETTVKAGPRGGTEVRLRFDPSRLA